MKLPKHPLQINESRRDQLGSYKLTPDERSKILAENERRGLSHLVKDRNLSKNDATPRSTD